jgi:hypothetical protein
MNKYDTYLVYLNLRAVSSGWVFGPGQYALDIVLMHQSTTREELVQLLTKVLCSLTVIYFTLTPPQKKT